MPTQMFIRNQLRYLENQLIEQDFPEYYLASGAGIEISNEIPKGAKTYSFLTYTQVGYAALMANQSDDIPLVDAYIDEHTGRIHEIQVAFQYSIADMDMAEYAGYNLNANLARVALHAATVKLDEVAWIGDARANLLGLANNPNVPAVIIAADGNSNGGTNSTKWANKTPDQIYRDLNLIANSIPTISNNVYRATRLALPLPAFQLISTIPYPANTSSTILDFFYKAQSAQIGGGITSVVPVPFLTGRGIGGADMAIAWNPTNGAQKLHISLDFTIGEYENRNLKYKFPCYMRTGGVEINRPLSLAYCYGI